MRRTTRRAARHTGPASPPPVRCPRRTRDCRRCRCRCPPRRARRRRRRSQPVRRAQRFGSPRVRRSRSVPRTPSARRWGRARPWRPRSWAPPTPRARRWRIAVDSRVVVTPGDVALPPHAAAKATISARSATRRKGTATGYRTCPSPGSAPVDAGCQPDERWLHAERLADPLGGQRPRPVGPSATTRPSVEHHQPREEVRGQRQVVEDGDTRRPVAPSRSHRSSMASTWWRRSRWTVGSSRMSDRCRLGDAPSRGGPADARPATARARRGRSGVRCPRGRSRPPPRPGPTAGAPAARTRGEAVRARRPPRRSSRRAARSAAGRPRALASAPSGRAWRSARRRAARVRRPACRMPGQARAGGSTCPPRSGR